MKTILLLLLLARTPLGAVCELAITLLPASTAVTPGQATRRDVVAINPRTTEAPFDVESSRAGTFRSGVRTWPVTLMRDGASPKAVRTGAFAASPFHFDVPADLPAGDIVLEVRGHDDAVVRATLEVAEPTASRSAADALRTPLDLLVARAPAMSALSRNFAGRFMPNQPIYFIAGGDQLDLAVPARLRLFDIEAYLHAQYFDGHGESLRDYRARTNTFRLGFARVR